MDIAGLQKRAASHKPIVPEQPLEEPEECIFAGTKYCYGCCTKLAQVLCGYCKAIHCRFLLWASEDPKIKDRQAPDVILKHAIEVESEARKHHQSVCVTQVWEHLDPLRSRSSMNSYNFLSQIVLELPEHDRYTCDVVDRTIYSQYYICDRCSTLLRSFPEYTKYFDADGKFKPEG